jgi:hypothetical protein
VSVDFRPLAVPEDAIVRGTSRPSNDWVASLRGSGGTTLDLTRQGDRRLVVVRDTTAVTDDGTPRVAVSAAVYSPDSLRAVVYIEMRVGRRGGGTTLLFMRRTGSSFTFERSERIRIF